MKARSAWRAVVLWLTLLAWPIPLVSAQTLRTNLRGDVATVDPAGFNGLVGNRLLALVYESLTAFSPDGRLVPALATGWETPDQGRTWRFRLRSGVRFHSGRPLTAADVDASFRMMLKARRPGLGASFLNKLAGRDDFVSGRADRLSGFVLIDPLTFDLRFTEPVGIFPLFPFFIFDSGAVKAWGDDWHAAHSGGTGPFRLTKWRRGGETRLEVNRDYWGEQPAVDGLLFLTLPSPDTALAMFDAGELDFVTLGEPAHRLLVADRRYRNLIQAAPRLQSRFLGMNPTRYPPFADVRVRAAVSLAVDRQAVIDGIYGGLAVMEPGYGVASLTPADAEKPPPIMHRYDPDEAKRLLIAAGHPDGRGLPPVELATMDFLRVEAGYYAAQLRAVLGMEVNVRTMDRATMNGAANAGALSLFLAGWTADFPEPSTYLDSLWHGSSPFNQVRLHDPDYDALIDRARRSADADERRRLYVEAERRLAETVPAAMLPTPMNLILRRDNAVAVTVTPFGYLSFAPRAGQRRP